MCKVSYQDSLMTAGRNGYFVCEKVSYQNSLMTASKNDNLIGKGVCKCQLRRQPDDSRQQ
jgi:hypothetical protein